MERILTRTVNALQEQLKKGVFTPSHYEVSFQVAEDLDSVHVELSESEKMHLKGRIDRIDTAEDEEHVYVKVIDYKSGNKQFDLAALYYGLQLQLVVYMNAAMELVSKEHPGKQVIPAAMLYYHVDDPTVEVTGEVKEDEIHHLLMEKLRMNGVVNREPDIVKLLDSHIQEKSEVIPVEIKKDGDYSARSGILSGEDFQIISRYVNDKMKRIGREIMDGKIAKNPYKRGTEESCTYCSYKKICGFDSSMEGYSKRKLENLSKEEVFGRINEECGD